MSFEGLEEFIRIAKREGVSTLEYKTKDQKFSITLPGSVAPIVSQHEYVRLDQPVEKKEVDSGILEIKSPFVGTFYRSTSPGVDPYVKTGDRIDSGKILCIVEAMKIMNEIESEISGEIIEICVENENYVEYGQVLFKVKP